MTYFELQIKGASITKVCSSFVDKHELKLCFQAGDDSGTKSQQAVQHKCSLHSNH